MRKRRRRTRRRNRIMRRRRRWRGRGGMSRIFAGQPGGWGGHDGQLSLGPLTTCPLPLQLLLQGSLRQEGVKQSHCRDAQRPIMHTRLIYFLTKNLFIGDSFVQFPSSYTYKTCGNAFWRGESLPRHQITCHLPFCPACRPSATTAARTSQETPGCLSTCWWSMKLAAPPKYCMKDTWPCWWNTGGSASPSAT